jgi:hypothetical protein
MGIGYFLSSFAFLSGPPIAGALVSNGTHWSKGIIFNGVRSHTSLLWLLFELFTGQVIVVASFPILLISRYGHARRKKTPYV